MQVFACRSLTGARIETVPAESRLHYLIRGSNRLFYGKKYFIRLCAVAIRHSLSLNTNLNHYLYPQKGPLPARRARSRFDFDDVVRSGFALSRRRNADETRAFP